MRVDVEDVEGTVICIKGGEQNYLLSLFDDHALSDGGRKDEVERAYKIRLDHGEIVSLPNMNDIRPIPDFAVRWHPAPCSLTIRLLQVPLSGLLLANPKALLHSLGVVVNMQCPHPISSANELAFAKLLFAQIRRRSIKVHSTWPGV